jgi:hypothetical protein
MICFKLLFAFCVSAYLSTVKSHPESPAAPLTIQQFQEVGFGRRKPGGLQTLIPCDEIESVPSCAGIKAALWDRRW